jgi:two-component system, chemotaxis family, response regulator Rcp1
MGTLTQSSLRVLIVDDCRADLRLLSDGFRAAGRPTEIYTAENGEQALAFLLGDNSPKPDIVMLDVNMPRVSGHEVLCRIKQHDDLRATVVLMFSSSGDPRDILQAYQCHANGYLTKPSELDEYYELAKQVADFWGGLNKLPRQ